MSSVRLNNVMQVAPWNVPASMINDDFEPAGINIPCPS